MSTTNLKRAVAALAVTAGLLAAAGPASAQIAPASISIGTAEVFELNTVKPDSSTVAVESIAQAREPAQTVTMLDYMGSP